MSIVQNINQIRQKLLPGVKLVAVSKTKPESMIMEAYNAGQRIFGENRPQELKQKYENLPKDIEWHFIGHLQTNKIKYIAPFVSLIHGVDSFRLLQAINKEGEKNNRIIPCLLQFHIASEETKFGFVWEEVVEMLSSTEYKELKHISLAGVMGMATYTDNQEQVSREFQSLKEYFDRLKQQYFEGEQFKEISMGMSGDFKIAMLHGSTMVRIGSDIFGHRTYL